MPQNSEIWWPLWRRRQHAFGIRPTKNIVPIFWRGNFFVEFFEGKYYMATSTEEGTQKIWLQVLNNLKDLLIKLFYKYIYLWILKKNFIK